MGNFRLVFRVWLISLKFWLASLRALYNFIFFPVIILSFLGVAVSYDSSFAFLNMFMHLVFYVMFAVAWHNFILADDSGKTIWHYLRWDMSKWRYLGVFLLMIFAVVLAMNISVRPSLWLLHGLNNLSLNFGSRTLIEEIPSFTFGVVDLFAGFGFLLLCYPLSRFVFLFPLAALGRSNMFRSSWELSSEAVIFCFILFLSLGFVQLLFSLCGIIFRYGIGFYFGSDLFSLTLLNELVWQFFNYMTLSILVTTLSIAFVVLDGD